MFEKEIALEVSLRLTWIAQELFGSEHSRGKHGPHGSLRMLAAVETPAGERRQPACQGNRSATEQPSPNQYWATVLEEAGILFKTKVTVVSQKERVGAYQTEVV